MKVQSLIQDYGILGGPNYAVGTNHNNIAGTNPNASFTIDAKLGDFATIEHTSIKDLSKHPILGKIVDYLA